MVIDPLQWWKSNENMLPCLSLYARRVLCIVATSAPCETPLSAIGLVISGKRSRLKPALASPSLY